MPAALAISPEVEREIAALKTTEPKNIEGEIIELKNARQLHDTRKAAKTVRLAIANANAQLFAFQSDLRQVLHKAETEWTRAELAVYRGAFVQATQHIDALFGKAEELFDDAKHSLRKHTGDLSGTNSSATRRYLRGVVRDAIELMDDRVRQQSRFQSFVRKDFLATFDQRLLELSKEMSVAQSTGDVTARYPTVLEYLAR